MTKQVTTTIQNINLDRLMLTTTVQINNTTMIDHYKIINHVNPKRGNLYITIAPINTTLYLTMSNITYVNIVDLQDPAPVKDHHEQTSNKTGLVQRLTIHNLKETKRDLLNVEKYDLKKILESFAPLMTFNHLTKTHNLK